MKYSAAVASLLALGASAAPLVSKRAYSTNIDATILQYALTLEHLENVFYKQALSTFTPADFTAAGFTAAQYNVLKYVAHDEEAHVTFLEAGLTAAGVTPNAACTYSFGYTGVAGFLKLASVIEGVGVAAYLGAAPLITAPAYLTAAGSILVTEALHQSYLRNTVSEIPMAMPFGTPMGLNATYSIAAQFITSCPSTNAPLPVSSYPALALAQGLPTATGISFQFSTAATVPAGSYVTFIGGLTVAPMAATLSATSSKTYVTANIPSAQDFTGQVYAFITKDGSGNLTQSNIVAGPAILEVTPNAPTYNVTLQ